MHRISRLILIITGLLAFSMVSVATHSAETNNANKPRVPFQYALGLKKFQAMCSECHGEWGKGAKKGPPLTHRYYKPSHHNDNAFYHAALKGVKGHHWNFGDMPPVPGITKQDLDVIVPFVRWLQQESGIY